MVSVNILNAQTKTIGIEKTTVLSDQTSGNFLTVTQITIEKDLYKFDLALFKTKTAFLNGAAKMPYKYEVQVSGSEFVYNTESMYDAILQDSTFLNAKRIYQ